MKADAYQVAGDAARNTRTLKIEETGDFAERKIKPRIRLTGYWLERAGFKPGHRVEVQSSEPGTLTLRVLAESDPVVK
jgi:hypothetical protein